MTAAEHVAIVDDDDAVRDSLDVLIRASGHETVTFATAGEFLGACLDDAACVLLDVRLPDGDGIQILQDLIDKQSSVPIIIITGHGDVPMAVKAMRIGAVDFVEKPCDPDELIATIDRAIAQRRKQSSEPEKTKAAQERIERLTKRELEVLEQLVLGRQNKVIAHELGLSPRTVEVHRARVMEKTGADSLSGLVRLAITAGIDPEA